MIATSVNLLISLFSKTSIQSNVNTYIFTDMNFSSLLFISSFVNLAMGGRLPFKFIKAFTVDDVKNTERERVSFIRAKLKFLNGKVYVRPLKNDKSLYVYPSYKSDCFIKMKPLSAVPKDTLVDVIKFYLNSNGISEG